MQPKSARTTPFVTALAMAAIPTSLSAQIVWDGDVDNTYETDANWVGDVAPADDLTTDVAELNADVTLSTTRQVSGIDFASAATLSGGSIEIGTSGLAVNADAVISSDLVVNTALNTTLNGSLGLSGTITGTADMTFTAGTSTALSITGTSGNDNSSGYSGNLTFDGVDVTASRWFMGGGGSGLTLSLLNGSSLSATNHLVLGNRDIVISGGASINQFGSNNIYRFGGVISGTGGLTFGHVGGGNGDKVQLDGVANTYTGGTTIDNTDVHIKGNLGLGAAGEGLTLQNGGKLVTLNNVNLGARTLTLGSGGGIIGTANKVVTLGGGAADTITGTGSLTIEGGNTVHIDTHSNSFSGATTINGTKIEVGVGTTGFLGTSAITLDNGGTISGDGSHVNMGGTSLVIGSGGGTLQNSHARALYNVNNVSGDGLLTLDGDGSAAWPSNSRIQMNGTTNTYTGGTLITNKANAIIYGDGSLGAADTKVTLDDGRFFTQNAASFGNREFEIASGGGMIALGGKSSTISGAITGTGDLEINGQNRDDDSGSPSGTLRITSANNTLSGAVLVDDNAHLEMDGNNALGTGAITLDTGARFKNRDSHTVLDNDVTIGSGGAELMAGWNKSLTLNGVVSGSGDITIESDSGAVILGGANTHTGNIIVNAHGSSIADLRVTGSLGSGSYGGVISGDGDVEFAGAGTQTLTGVNTYTGATIVSSGNLIVDGSIASSSSISVESGAQLGGSGPLGDLTIAAGGAHNPGNSPGIATVGNYTMAGTLNAEIEGTTAGTQHDQVQATGTVDLSGVLNPIFSNSYSEGDLIFLILNDGADSVTGTFAGLAQGATAATYGGYNWLVSYEADGDGGSSFTGGNDVALLATAIPEPSTALLGGLGLLALLGRRRRAS